MSQNNDIPNLQNLDAQIMLRKAARSTFDRAMYLAVLQVLLTVVVPVAGSVLNLFSASARPFVAALALLITVIDSAVLDRTHKRILKRAARFSEKFDCRVLSIPWDSFTVGDEPLPEETRQASRGVKAERLEDWYPTAVGGMPLHFARFICQRANLRYDSQLRRWYGRVVLGASLILLAAFLAHGFACNLTMTAFTLSLAPATPILTWSLREFFRQKDAADALEELMKKAQRAWNDALAAKDSLDDCLLRSREFQSAIFARRSSAPSVLPLVYRFQRFGLEDEMNAAAHDFMKQYEEKLHTA